MTVYLDRGEVEPHYSTKNYRFLELRGANEEILIAMRGAAVSCDLKNQKLIVCTPAVTVELDYCSAVASKRFQGQSDHGLRADYNAFRSLVFDIVE